VLFASGEVTESETLQIGYLGTLATLRIHANTKVCPVFWK